MSEQWLYLESSALVKLVVTEAESPALRAFIVRWPLRASSALSAVEVPRAARRLSADPVVHTRAEQLVEGLDLVALEMGVLRAAGRMGPALLRSLDAIHLASAQALGTDLGGIVTYDDRVADAARAAGIPVFRPR